jgi:hypothetical protein
MYCEENPCLADEITILNENHDRNFTDLKANIKFFRILTHGPLAGWATPSGRAQRLRHLCNNNAGQLNFLEIDASVCMQSAGTNHQHAEFKCFTSRLHISVTS